MQNETDKGNQSPRMTFDDWLEKVYVWPANLPKECEMYEKNEGADCISTGHPAPCPSCVEFAKACEDYENDMEGTHEPPK